MYNPFSREQNLEMSDEELVSMAREGNRDAVERLIHRHQGWIYNISLRMVLDPQDAEDITQDVLIKIINKLHAFKGDSKFSTWVYKITANHVINMKERILEKKELPFTYYWRKRKISSEAEFPDRKSLPVDLSLLVQEARIGCMLAMLIYLKRDQRLIYILGEIFGVSDAVGSQIMEISKGNFRQILFRARRRVYDFMHHKCGLICSNSSCTCDWKIKDLLGNGKLDSDKLMFTRNYRQRVIQLATERRRELSNFMDRYCQRLFREHPFYTPPNFVETLQRIMECDGFKKICD
jgi:RNA polymerase sigma factor (sigma-70 family)